MHDVAVIPNRLFMKRALLYMAGVVVVSGASIGAQTITGTWQGTLPVAENPRVVLKIAKDDDGSLRGTYYAIDRGPEGIPLTSVSFVAPELNVAFIYGDIGYNGNLSADGKTLDGTWTQGKQTYPLTLVLATPSTMWRNAVAAGMAPMAATADPSFEVATIKPSAPGAQGAGYALRTRHSATQNKTIKDLIEFAYYVRDRQIEGGPPWLNEARFDIAGEPDKEGLPSVEQYRVMVKKLLADRFQLTVHSVQKVFPVYALTVEKSPPKLTRSDPEAHIRDSIYVKPVNDQMMVQYVARTMPMFADILMNVITVRQIVDETGLTGSFDFTLMMPANATQVGANADDRANAYFGAVQTLGLKLVPKREPIEVIVVDGLERPSAN
jgi:uncharacterized protein (TIGR03435 family)